MDRISFKRLVRWFLLFVLLCWISLSLYHSFKSLPAGISMATSPKPVSSVRFWADFTWVDQDGIRRSEQQIFNRILELINQAEQLLVLDMFLFNDFAGDSSVIATDPNMRPLSEEVASALISRKKQVPELRIVVITDPINHLYGGVVSERFNAMQQAGIELLLTDLDQLRDSNFIWSGFWRFCCRWFGNSVEGGWLPNPVGSGKVTLRTWLKMANFKANHRKIMVVDSGPEFLGLVTSANPHDASSAHGNVALEFSGAGVFDLLDSEQAVLDFSEAENKLLMTDSLSQTRAAASKNSLATIEVLTESKILDRVIETLNSSGSDDRIDLSMFYLSHRDIVHAMIEAYERGVKLRVLLDPSEDAFGKKKNGIPNRQVAYELTQRGIPVRWCDTHGEQCHSKMMLTYRDGDQFELMLGSANFTRRNVDDLNLETNVVLVGQVGMTALDEAAAYFNLYWNNAPNRYFSQPYEYYADDSQLRYWRYRIMEATGMSTF